MNKRDEFGRRSRGNAGSVENSNIFTENEDEMEMEVPDQNLMEEADAGIRLLQW